MRGRWPGIVGAETTPVGAFSPDGDSPYGCADMAGNVWEWTRSLWAEYPYPDGAQEREAREELTSEKARVLRGGAFFFEATIARCSARFEYHPGSQGHLIGFRLSLSPFSSDL